MLTRGIGEASISNMSGSTRSKAPRKKGKTPKSGKSSLDNHMKLAYNILKNFEDDIVVDKEIESEGMEKIPEIRELS